jgi:nucleotide-binding universal stress UspA family protein
MNTFKFNIKKILVPIDFSYSSIKALDHAIYMAKINKAEIVLVHIFEGGLSVSGPENLVADVNNSVALESTFINKYKADLDKLAERVRKKSLKVSVITQSGSAHKEIVKVAKTIKADIIVMGTHGISGIREFIIGSNAVRVISEAHCPVLSVQEHIKKSEFKNILLPFRAKAHSREKIDYAIKIAKQYGSTIHVLGIDTEENTFYYNLILLEAQQIKKIIEKQNLACKVEVISSGYLSKLILNYAQKKKADLIVVMSDMDKANISEYVMGPVAQQIINHSHIPVLSIRPAFNPNTIALHGYGW